MLNKNEMKILEKMIENLSSEFTLLGMSKALNQKYSQTYKSIKSLIKQGLVKIKQVGKSKVIKLDFSKYHTEYAIAEIERLKETIKNKNVLIAFNKILKINKQFTCILFGSYALRQFKKDSDMDLLFIIPNEYNTHKFEKIVENNLSIHKVDINIVTEDSLFEMWAAPEKLNVGTELFKNHIVLIGAESFINLVRKRYVGR